MSEQKTFIEQIISQAIRFEENSQTFYTMAAGKVKDEAIKGVLLELAEQEVEHKRRLQQLLEGDVSRLIAEKQGDRPVQDLGLADYLVVQPLSEDATFQDVLIVAMKRELNSYTFYNSMAAIAADDQARQLFEFLAQEELKHKNRVESIYDEEVYKEF